MTLNWKGDEYNKKRINRKSQRHFGKNKSNNASFHT